MSNSIIFYENSDGFCEILNLLEELRIKSRKSKDARIQYKQISLYIELLERNGTNLPSNVTKHITGPLWELRPGHNRVLYFYHKDGQYVLLHSFRKTTQKTPSKEIDKAFREIDDFLRRKETHNENLG